ncbi:MAG: transposase family protein [Christensenellaceae bacterium]|nr:transposase family protein [Christensenellaceae bacterium]
MPERDYTTDLLDMEHMKVLRTGNFPDRIILHVKMKRREVQCPRCGTITSSVHDYRTQQVKDCPVQGRSVIWQYRKRRYRCPC